MREYRHNEEAGGAPQKISNQELKILHTAEKHSQRVVATFENEASRLCRFGLLSKVRDTQIPDIKIYGVKGNWREILKKLT